MEHSDGVARNWVGVLNVGVQRELFDGFSASFNWYRRDTYDSVLRVNRALGFDDYTGFLLDNPCAANASPGFLSCTQSGGQVPAQISVFNLNPAAAGIADDWVVQNTPTGEDFSEVYNGFETGFNARLGNGSTIFGGWVMERNVFIRCDIPHDPNRLLFCDPRGRNDMVGGVPITQPAYPIPFLQEFKISGTFPLPGNFWISGSAQFYPAQEAVAGGSQDQWGGTHRGGELSGARPYSGNINYNVTPANVMDNLGIARTEGISVPLLPAGQLFYVSPDPDRRLGPSDVHPGERDAPGPAGRHVQHHQLPADPERHQHLRRLAGSCELDHSGPVRPVRDEHPLVVATQEHDASRK